MVVYNAITGKRRRMPRNQLPRKKRYSLASTVASRMYSNEALQAFEIFVVGARLHLAFLSFLLAIEVVQAPERNETSALISLVFICGSCYFRAALQMLSLDSALMDLTDEQVAAAGYTKALSGVTLDSFENADECHEKIWFTRK